MNIQFEPRRFPSLRLVGKGAPSFGKDVAILRHEEVENQKEEHSQRILIDYTISNCRMNTNIACTHAPQLSSFERTRRVQPKSILPPFINQNETLSKSFHKQHDVSSLKEERIDFFLRIKKKRATLTTIHDFRTGLEKARLHKSPLFGAFGENGKRRSSYVDLKRAWSIGQGMGSMHF